MVGREAERRAILADSVRRIGLGGVVATAVALMVLLAPTASAFSPSSVKTLKAPYAGTESSYEDANFQGCGATAVWARTPFFNLTTGHDFAVAQANSTSCGRTNSSAGVYSEPEYASNALALPTVHGSVAEHWTVSFSVHLVATPGASGSAVATVELYLYSYIYDSTNGSYIDTTAAGADYKSITTGSFTKTFTGVKLVDYVNGTFAAKDSYYLYAGLDVLAYAETSSGHAVAGAYINAGLSGKFANLTSITVP
jgi:hypothetical protein